MPVLVTVGSDASRNLDRMRDDFQMIAAAVGKVDEAEQVLEEFDAALAEGRQAIADAGAARRAVRDRRRLDGRAAPSRSGCSAKGALVSQVGDRARAAQRLARARRRGVGARRHRRRGPHRARRRGDPLPSTTPPTPTTSSPTGWPGNPIWESLPFVERGQVHRVTDGIWTFGGPASCRQYIDELVGTFRRDHSTPAEPAAAPARPAGGRLRLAVTFLGGLPPGGRRRRSI